MGFLGDAHGCGGCKKVSHISYNDKTWRSYILPKEDPKNVVLKNMLTILMMSAKVATPGLLKIKLFLNKGYDVIISFRGVSNKIFSCDSN